MRTSRAGGDDEIRARIERMRPQRRFRQLVPRDQDREIVTTREKSNKVDGRIGAKLFVTFYSRAKTVMPILRRFTIAVVLIFGVGSGHASSFNIVVVGASNTVGWGVGTENAFPARLQTILKERGSDATRR